MRYKFPLFLFSLLACSFSCTVPMMEVSTEKSLLLEFKSSVVDSDGVLSTWKNNTSHCSWFGVTCNSNSKVVSLSIHGGERHAGNSSGLSCFMSLEFPYCRSGIRRRCVKGVGKLRGKLPPLIGKLSDLRVLSFPFNGFGGEVPVEIWVLERLEVLNLDGNLLSGRLPCDFAGLRKLRVLNLGFNLLVGEIPVSIKKCVDLEVLNLAGNKLQGPLPSFFRDLLKLRLLHLANNELNGRIPNDFGSNCGDLQHLDLSGNNLIGRIPKNLGICRGLKTLLLYSNMLSGDIPRELGQLRKLNVLDVSQNFIGGVIPAEIGNCIDLSVLVVSNMFATWPNKEKACGESSAKLSRYGNNEHNHFSGSIPSEITILPKLRILWAPRASLDGQLPSNWGECETLEMINLAQNSFVGSVHGVFERCKKLRHLDLSLNRLSEKVDQKLPDMSVLSNSICHHLVPVYSNSIQSRNSSFTYRAYFMQQTCLASHLPFSTINVSSSGMSSPLRSSVEKNLSSVRETSSHRLSHRSMLSGSSPTPGVTIGENTANQFNAISNNRSTGLNSIEIASITSAAAIVTVLLVLIALFFYTRKWIPDTKVRVSEPKPITIFNDIGIPLLYENIVQATGYFNASNCIGSGGFGATYKAEISPGTLVAVKRLATGRFQGVQQFDAEIMALGRIRHPNLVTLIGYHASESEMFLIYNYLSGGNLENFIKERSQIRVNWKILHKIALDIARALCYLHDQCAPKVLHRDVKPSNILLDNTFNAYLSDFGLARLLGTSETHATTGVAGTFGYVAPEYAMTCRVSEKADVYSYGVVLLELISDKRALDPSFSVHEDGFNIVSWACMLLSHGRAKEVFTTGLWESGPHDDLVEVLHLAVTCTVETLSVRPTMKQVVQRLKQLQPTAL